MHAGLGPGVRLTRREWGAVRRALGRPRRLSLTFLREERAKLESYRNIVRAKYEEVSFCRSLRPVSDDRSGLFLNMGVFWVCQRSAVAPQ